MKITIKVSEQTLRIAVSKDQAKKDPRKEGPKLVKGYILKDWNTEE
ncbi:MAG: hypothetical protein IKI66_06035 [Bacteroidales bacterium]|nr:hypothetical protein [Bacteroidales bacterium]